MELVNIENLIENILKGKQALKKKHNYVIILRLIKCLLILEEYQDLFGILILKPTSLLIKLFYQLRKIELLINGYL